MYVNNNEQMTLVGRSGLELQRKLDKRKYFFSPNNFILFHIICTYVTYSYNKISEYISVLYTNW